MSRVTIADMITFVTLARDGRPYGMPAAADANWYIRSNVEDQLDGYRDDLIVRIRELEVAKSELVTPSEAANADHCVDENESQAGGLGMTRDEVLQRYEAARITDAETVKEAAAKECDRNASLKVSTAGETSGAVRCALRIRALDVRAILNAVSPSAPTEIDPLRCSYCKHTRHDGRCGALLRRVRSMRTAFDECCECHVATIDPSQAGDCQGIPPNAKLGEETERGKGFS